MDIQGQGAQAPAQGVQGQGAQGTRVRTQTPAGLLLSQETNFRNARNARNEQNRAGLTDITSGFGSMGINKGGKRRRTFKRRTIRRRRTNKKRTLRRRR